MNASIRHFQVGGTLSPRESVYVSRPEDDQFFSLATEERSWINVYGCRTMGKSSLYAQHLDALAQRGITGIVVDVAAEVGEQHASASEWFRALGEAWTAGQHLSYDILDDVLSGLRADAAAGTVAEQLLSNALPRQIAGRVLLILDEYDYIDTLPYSDEILYALRHIQAAQARKSELPDLSVCLVGLRPITNFGKAGAANTSPICIPVQMLDFVASQNTIDTLLGGFPPTEPRPSEDIVRHVIKLSGGQPLLTMQLLAEARNRRCAATDDVQRMAESLVARSGLGADVQLFESIERAIVESEGKTFAALGAYEALLKDSAEAHAEPASDLLLIFGLLRRNGERLEIKGALFRRRFDIAWVNRMMKRVATSGRMQQYRGSASTDAKRICVINAGGTLGMVQRGTQVVAPRDAAEFKAYFTELDSIASTVEFINLFPPRDSINVFPDQWVTIARYIFERRHDGFDGFVVAHGTDTMAYTASAVAFALGPQLPFPVVFTGAQTTPDVAYGDAHVNLYRACEVAKKAIPEVVISFGNFVYRAVRAQKKDDRRFDGFESPTYPPLAEITGEINVRMELLRSRPDETGDIELRADFEQSILIVPQFPGLEPAFFTHLLDENGETQGCKGVIVQTLGAGNVASQDPYSFIPFVHRAYEQGIPVIVTSQYPPDPGSHAMYTPAQAPIEAGAIHAGNMTTAAAVTKFRWVLAHVGRMAGWHEMLPAPRRDLVSKLMVEQSIVGEF